MLFGRDDNIDADEFWKERERDLGTAVLEKTLGQVITENENAPPLWGIFYTTEKALYFQTFYSENWLSAMFSGGKGRSRSKDEIIEIPADNIELFQVRPKKTGFMRIFHQPTIVELVWTSPFSGKKETVVFSTEGDAEALISSISIP